MSDITVKVGRMPGSNVKAVTVPQGTTAADAIRKASLSAEGMEIRVNGRSVGGQHVLANGETVLLLRKIRGA